MQTDGKDYWSSVSFIIFYVPKNDGRSYYKKRFKKIPAIFLLLFGFLKKFASIS